MSLSAHVGELCGIFIVVVIAVLWNVFNLAVIVLHQWRTGSCKTLGLIISCISVSNVLLELALPTMQVLLWEDILFSLNCLHVLRAIVFIWLQSNCVSFWTIAWLSVFYCVKIVRASSTLLRKLKRNISNFIKVALLVTVLTSIVACLPFLFLQLKPLNGTQNTNGTRIIVVLPPWIDMNLYIYLLLGFLCPVPVLIMLPTSLRLVVHLYQHTLAMRKNENQFQGTDTYLLVCKLTVSMVGVYMATVAVLIFFLVSWSAGNFPFREFVWDLSFFCLATGFLLTLLNKQTKEKLESLCCWGNVRRPSAIKTETMAAPK